MARIVDTNKLERLKAATMKLVAEKGYGGASAALIAKEAKVSTGYFYMHYKGKYELVNTLLLEVYEQVAQMLDRLINEDTAFDDLINSVVRYFFNLANTDPVKVKFFNVLSNDYRFKSNHETRELINICLGKVMRIGERKNQLDKNIGPNELFLILVINTIQFINQQFKNTPSEPEITEEEESRYLYLVNKILK